MIIYGIKDGFLFYENSILISPLRPIKKFKMIYTSNPSSLQIVTTLCSTYVPTSLPKARKSLMFNQFFTASSLMSFSFVNASKTSVLKKTFPSGGYQQNQSHRRWLAQNITYIITNIMQNNLPLVCACILSAYFAFVPKKSPKSILTTR